LVVARVVDVLGAPDRPAPPPKKPLRKPYLSEVMSTAYDFTGPLLWLGHRLGRNRERAGLHYPSDSSASRWIAGAIAALLTTRPLGGGPSTPVPAATPPDASTSVTNNDLIDCPTLQRVLTMARAERIRGHRGGNATMRTIDDWTFDKQLVWTEALGGTPIMLRHPTYPAEDTWHDDQGPAALQSIAVKYLRKVTGPVDRKGTGALDLPELFDEEGTFKVPLAWLPVEVSETPSPRSSYLLTPYAQPLPASDVLDRTAVLMAVESTEAKKEQPLG